MDTVQVPDDHAESAFECRRRMVTEAEGIEQARASIAAGRVTDEQAVDNWIDSLGTDRELPIPFSGR